MKSTLVPLHPVERDTIPRIFFGGIDRHGGARAMLQRGDDGTWTPLSHAEVEARVTAVAAALDAAGIAAGDRVAILSENRRGVGHHRLRRHGAGGRRRPRLSHPSRRPGSRSTARTGSPPAAATCSTPFCGKAAP